MVSPIGESKLTSAMNPYAIRKPITSAQVASGRSGLLKYPISVRYSLACSGLTLIVLFRPSVEFCEIRVIRLVPCVNCPKANDGLYREIQSMLYRTRSLGKGLCCVRGGERQNVKRLDDRP